MRQNKKKWIIHEKGEARSLEASLSKQQYFKYSKKKTAENPYKRKRERNNHSYKRINLYKKGRRKQNLFLDSVAEEAIGGTIRKWKSTLKQRIDVMRSEKEWKMRRML